MGDINWKVAADRMTIGEKVELTTLPGYWVRPRKYSKAGEAEILAAQTRAVAQKRAVASSIIDAYDAQPANEADAMVGSRAAGMQREVQILVMQNASAAMVGHIDEDQARIAFGIEDHNFNGEIERASMDWAREVMEHAEIANELLAIVAEKNRPLVRPTSPSSETSPNGSTTEPSSPEATPKSEA